MGALGRLLGRLGGDQKITKITCKKRSTSRRILNHSGTFIGRPKGSQKRFKMAPKTSSDLQRSSRAKQLLFKSLLEPSWVDLGRLRPPFSCSGSSGARFLKNHIFSQNRAWKAILGAKSVENDPQEAPKLGSKSVILGSKSVILGIDFSTIFACRFKIAPRPPKSAPRPPKSAPGEAEERPKSGQERPKSG